MLKVVVVGALVLAAVIGADNFRSPLAKPSATAASEKPHLLDWNDGTLAAWRAKRALQDRWGSREFSDINTERAVDRWIVSGQAGSKDGWRNFRLHVSRRPKTNTLAVAFGIIPPCQSMSPSR
jgi:hypothetical protein